MHAYNSKTKNYEEMQLSPFIFKTLLYHNVERRSHFTIMWTLLKRNIINLICIMIDWYSENSWSAIKKKATSCMYYNVSSHSPNVTITKSVTNVASWTVKTPPIIEFWLLQILISITWNKNLQSLNNPVNRTGSVQFVHMSRYFWLMFFPCFSRNVPPFLIIVVYLRHP